MLRRGSFGFAVLGLTACHLIGGAGDLTFADEDDATGGGGLGTAGTTTSPGAGGRHTGGGDEGGDIGAGGEPPSIPRASCVGHPAICGESGTEDCCASIAVPGSSFDHFGASLTVSSFRLDRFEVTVGRFRSFVNAVVEGWRPAPGAGRHGHLPGGALADDAETGWQETWTELLPTTAASWDDMLSCEEFGPLASAYAQWTPTVGEYEQRPINCMSWYAAYAFCVFDGGFLPTEAEWSLAATDGRPSAHPYPWGEETPSSLLANYGCQSQGCDHDSLSDVGMHPMGAAPRGHEDMAGNVWEWTLDRFSEPFAKPSCVDCVALGGTGNFAVRGGAFGSPSHEMTSDTRATFSLPRGGGIGIRCATPPHGSQL